MAVSADFCKGERMGVVCVLALVKNDKTVRFPAEDLDPIAPPIDEQEEGPD
jgi:hypothetical protein